MNVCISADLSDDLKVLTGETATTPLCNILDYWRERQFAFSGLSRIARDILAIPAASVGVEWIFNSA